LPAHGWFPTSTESGEGAKALERIGTGLVTQPIKIVVELPEGSRVVAASSLRGLRRLSDSILTDPRVERVTSLVSFKEQSSILAYSVLYSDLPAARAEFPDLLDSYLSEDGRAAAMDVILRDTVSLTSAMDAVRHVRGLAHAPIKGLDQAKVWVGGFIASSLDLQTLMLKAFPRLVCIILAVTAVMLALTFRSVLVPLKAVILNSLSVAASFGLIVLVFQEGWGSRFLGLEGPTSAIFVVVPVLVFSIVFGLSMDYEVFLLVRIKEAFDRTGDNDLAVAEGLSASASTITSAALIMILVFGAFAFAKAIVMQFIGFGLATAVFLDATLIRMVLVPAIMRLAGEWNWWPGGRR